MEAKALIAYSASKIRALAQPIEASQQSRWFRFTDGIVIKIAGTTGKNKR